MDNLIQDLRYGVRMLGERPLFTAIAALTFALGLGANAAIFSVVNTVLLRPLSYPEPDRVVALWESLADEARGRSRVTPADFLDWKQRNRVFQEMAAYGAAGFNLTGAGEPEQILGARVSSGYFEVLNIQPVLGRGFISEEYHGRGDRVVMLGHDVWARRFGSDPDITGRPITLDGQSYTVIGVMPRGVYPTWPTASGQVSFDPKNAEFWIPMAFDAEWAANRRTHVLGVIGRLRHGVTLEQASAELRTIASQLERENPEENGVGIVTNRLMDEVVGPVRPALLILLGAVGLVLLMACTNIGGLLLVELAGRRREIAIRAALGATRVRLIRQLLVECCLLQVLGGAVGIWLASIGVAAIQRSVVQQIPRLDAVKLDSTVLSLSLIVSLATAIPFSLMMGWQWSELSLQETLNEGGRAPGGGSARNKLRRALVVAQVSIAVTLMVGAGLLIRSFWMLRRVDPGFNPNRVLTLNLSLPGSQYRDWGQISSFYNRLLDRIQALPGVEAAATAYDQPLQSNWIDGFTIEGRPALAPDQVPSADFHPVSPAYFTAVGIELMRGRSFIDQDDPGHRGATIINRAFARSYFPDEEPLGKRLQILSPSRFWPGDMPVSFEIVGIVGDVKSSGLNKQAEPAFYVPARQMPTADVNVLVRTAGDPALLIGAVRDAVWQIDANQPIAGISTLERIVSDSIAQPRLATVLMALFGLGALGLTTLGIYGLLSHTVRQRTHEIGVRMALGSRRADVVMLMVSDGLLLTMAGIGIGIAASIALTRLLSGLLFGIRATDPLTFVVAPITLVVAAALASYLPARRAARVDPMVALRE